MTTYYLIRHGDTFVTEESKGFPHYGFRNRTIPILKTSIPRIKRASYYLKTKKISACYSSYFVRCVETSAVIEKIIKKEFIYDLRLNDYYIEFPWQFVKRIRSFLEDVKKENHRKVLICTHGFVISAIIQLLKEDKISLRKLFIYPKPGKIVTIRVK